MRKFTKKEIDYISINRGILSFKEIAKTLKREYKTLVNFSRKRFGKTCNRGKSNFSRKERDYDCNDLFFKNLNELSTYWAGFIAADGYVKDKINLLRIMLSSVDKDHLKKFLNNINFSGDVKIYKSKYTYNNITTAKEFCVLAITSKQLLSDLKNNFNIINKKSLVLQPPNLFDKKLIDAFIVGYIDGDGSIFFSECKRQEKIVLSMLGTLEMITWIQNRFSEILGKKIECIYKRKKDNKNTYVLTVSDRRARTIISHFLKIPVPKLERKWSEKVKDHCKNFKKFKNIDRYRQIYDLCQIKSSKEVALIMGMTIQAISWYQKQDIYKNFSKELDKEAINIEDIA